MTEAPAAPEVEIAPVPPDPEQAEVVDAPAPPAETPQAMPSQRVAPEVVANPNPEATPDPVEREEVAESDEPVETPAEEQEASAPEEASDRIVPETTDQIASAAPLMSRRPPSARPARPERVTETAAPAPEQTPEPEPEQTAEAPERRPSETRAAVDDALAEALGDAAQARAEPAGPPLSAGEKEALRVAVSRCWNVGSLSSTALNTTVVVGVSMAQDGTPDVGSIRLLSSSGGDGGAARQAFEAARRAIILCGTRGYDLPTEKYAQWRDIEMTFNPERMRIK